MKQNIKGEKIPRLLNLTAFSKFRMIDVLDTLSKNGLRAVDCQVFLFAKTSDHQPSQACINITTQYKCAGDYT